MTDNATPLDPSQTEPGATSENQVVIARQAILDEQRAVFGYELFDRSTAADSHTAASDAALLFNALSYAGSEALVGRKTVFINCTHASLTGPHLELIHPEKVVLEVPILAADATAEQIAEYIPVLQGARAWFPSGLQPGGAAPCLRRLAAVGGFHQAGFAGLSP